MNIFKSVLIIVGIIILISAITDALKQIHKESTSLSRILEQIQSMDSRQFEFFCARLFELQGYKTKVTKATGDGGKDIIMWQGSNKYYVECKHFKQGAKVSRCIANKLYGSMCGDGVRKGMIVTTGEFTKECREWCHKTGIKTLSYHDIVREIQKAGLEQVASAIRRL